MIEDKKINKLSPKKLILVAPLDWGLGHATRCIPLINQLLLSGLDVLIAAEGATATLLQREFPQLFILHLTGYTVKYSTQKKSLVLKLFAQLPKIFFAIYKEHKWLKKVIKKYKIDSVISDNRLGLYNKKISCVYITHQLSIITGSWFTQKIFRFIHYWFIKKYDECWVPDCKDNGLAGALSHQLTFPENVKYIGPLSRFNKISEAIIEYDLLILISGPEPQRSIFEKLLLNGLKKFNGTFLFVRGLPGCNQVHPYQHTSGKIINHISGNELNEVIQKSKIIISRSGYTTIMDLVKLQKKAIIIPTPGQTEQEYLANYLMKKNMFYTVQQNDFFLHDTLKKVSTFAFEIPFYNMDQYKIAVNNFVQPLLVLC